MHPRAGKQGHGDGKPNYPNHKFQIPRYQTEFTTIPGSCVPQRQSSNGVGPFHGWASQLKMLFKPERKHESVTPSISAYRENSVSGHAHLSPAFASQSSVDTQKRKGRREDFNVTIAAMRQFRGAGLEQTAQALVG